MSSEIPAAFRGSHPRLLILDVDGVLTDNQIWLNGEEGEWKAFFVPDGTGLRLLQLVGVEVAFVSGRASAVVHRRAREMKIERHHSGVHRKGEFVVDLLAETAVPAEQAVFVGDDLIDIPAMQAVRLPVAVANAHADVRKAACAVTTRPGGEGAVREVCEWILAARGEWELAKERYLR
ncbi:MAG: KdsC family phosphatase [Planctomycetota bacterium]